MGTVWALTSLLLLGQPSSQAVFCDVNRMTADLEQAYRESAERLRSETQPLGNVDVRARWRSVLPAVTFRSIVSEKTSGRSGTGSRFFSEIDSETVLVTSANSGFAESRSDAKGVAVLATWDFTRLVFSSGENTARVFRRESYVRSRRHNLEMLETVETARAAIRRLSLGGGDPVASCIDAKAALERVRSFN